MLLSFIIFFLLVIPAFLPPFYMNINCKQKAI